MLNDPLLFHIPMSFCTYFIDYTKLFANISVNALFSRRTYLWYYKYCFFLVFYSVLIQENVSFLCYFHETIIQTVFGICHAFEVERDLLLTKNRNIFSYQSTDWLKTWFLLFVSIKGKKNKSEFVTKLVGIIVTIILHKNVSRIANKIFATQRFCTDYLKHKNINKTTCRMPSANPRNLCVY